MTVQLVQSKSAGGTGTAPTLTFTTGPTAGNLLVTAVHSDANAAPTMTSTGWTALTAITDGIEGAQMFWKLALVGESSTVTGATSNAAWSIAAAEYNFGVHGTNILTKMDGWGTNSSATYPTASSRLATGSEILCVGFGVTTAPSATFSAPSVNSITATVRENSNQPTNASNIGLYDLVIGEANDHGGTLQGTATCSSSGASGFGGLFLAAAQQAGLPNLGRLKPHAFSPGNPR